jgi:DNA-binding NarL/FixJ family response regulator
MPEPSEVKPRILAVDDHPMVREGLRSMLAGAVAAWEEAGSADEALKKLPAAKPDLVLLDLNLPDVDGLTLLRRIKAAAPRTRVLVISMHDRPEHVREAMKLGAAGFVLKGLGRRELLAAVRAACAGESVITPALLQGLLDDTPAGAARGRPPGEPDLTRVEREVLTLVSQGLTNKEIAERLRWSVGNVKKYVQRILEKLDVSDRTQAAVEAVRRGLVDPPAG